MRSSGQTNPAWQKIIRFVLAVVIILFFCSTGFSATLQVPGEYKTIQEAIDKANSEDTVLVDSGIYTETLTLKPGLILKSRGTEKEHSDFTAAARTTISSPGRQAAIITGADGAILSGFTLVDTESGYNPTVSRYGVLIQGKSQTITNCIIANLPYDAIGVFGPQDKLETYIYNNLIFKNQGNGIVCQSNARVRIEQNLIHENERSGIENDKGVVSQVIGNVIFKNGVDGVMNSGAKPVIKNNDIFGNGLNGIGLQKGSQGIITKNKIHENVQAGIGLRLNARATIWDNKIYRNMIGVGCLDLGQVKIESNEIYENHRVGIGLMGCADRPVTIINNHIHDNRFMPISPNAGCDLVQSGNRF